MLCCNTVYSFLSVFVSACLQRWWRLHCIGLPSGFCQQLQILVSLSRCPRGVGYLLQHFCSALVVDLKVSSQIPVHYRVTEEAQGSHLFWDMSHSFHLGSNNHGLNAGGLCMIQDQVGDTLLPTNAKNMTCDISSIFDISEHTESRTYISIREKG